MDPSETVPVEDLSLETLRHIVAQLESSTDFEHLVAREAELNALYRLVQTALSDDRKPHDEQTNAWLLGLERTARDACDLVSRGETREASLRLRQMFPIKKI